MGGLRSLVNLLSIVVTCGVAASCASPLVTSARQDDLKTFQSTLSASPKPLTDDTLVAVAQAVAERELLTMPADAAVSRVTELHACVRELRETFVTLSERDDGVGAVATQVLLDEGLLPGERESLIKRHAASTDPDWRAVAARSAISSNDSEFRRRAFLDGDLRVRRAALRASRDARLVDDQDALFEAARLDPDPVARTFALEAISAVAEPATLERLRDLWPYADEAGRREIVLAWGRKDAFVNGGHGRLGWVLTTQSGLPQLAAAIVLLQRGAESNAIALDAASLKAAVANAAIRQGNPDAVAAESALVRGFRDGSVDEQEFVARYAPRTEALVQAFVEGLESTDERKVVNAAAVLVSAPTWRRAANHKLTALLTAKIPAVASQARDVLAAERAPQVKDILRKRLASAEPSARILAGTQLLKYHRAGERDLGFEQLLADPVASVRTTLSCRVLEQ